MRSRCPLILVLALLAGCRPSAPGGAAPAPRVGPSMERLYDQLYQAKLTPAEKQAYWESVRGRLVRHTGEVVAVSDAILVQGPVNEGRAEQVCVRARPEAVEVLGGVHEGQRIAVLGELVRRDLDLKTPRPCDATFEVRNARVMVK